MATRVWEAQSKGEARLAYAEADKQDLIVKQAYRVYYKAAMAVADLWKDYDHEKPAKNTPEYRQWMLAVQNKESTYKSWQREAHKHGNMFVPLMDKPPSENANSKEPW